MLRCKIVFTRSQLAHISLCFHLLIALVAVAPHPAQAAFWPSWLLRSTPAPTGLTSAVAALRALPVSPSSPAVAVHATPEGHWQFINRAGESFTAGTPAEIKRAGAVVVPDAVDGFASATLILSQDTLFVGTAVLQQGLPIAKAYLTSLGGDMFPVERTGDSGLTIMVRPGVALVAETPEMLEEAFGQLRRPLDASRLRVVSATPGGPSALSATPTLEAGQNGPALDAIEPDHLVAAMAALARQTVILIARMDGISLAVQPASGAERTLSTASLNAAVASDDIDLLILHSDPPRQPGGRNWLWQRVQVSGLEHASKRATFADFLDQMASGHDPFLVSLSFEGTNRVRLTAQPVRATITSTRGVTGWLKQATGTVTGQLTGAVEPHAIHASLVSMHRRTQLTYRLFATVPVTPVALYFGSLVLGLAGLPVSRRWWAQLWPSEVRSDYTNAYGFLLARIFRGAAFVSLFLPIVALPAALVSLKHWLWRPAMT